MKNIFKSLGLILLVSLTINLTVAGQVKKSKTKFDAKKGALINENAAEDWFMETEGRIPDLFIHEVGSGEPVIVIHGGPGAGHRYMTGIAKGLENQFRFVFYDQRGVGYSFAARENISMPKNVEDLERIRKAYGVEKISIISHSAGTYLAMEYLRTFPQSVKNIVLVGATDPKNGNKNFYTPQELELYAKLKDVVKQFNERPEVLAEIEKAGLNKPNLTAKQKYQYILILQSAGTIYKINRWRENIFIATNLYGAGGAREGMNFVYDWSKMLAGHPHAITVINGEYDYAIGPKGSPVWKRLVTTEAKNVRLLVIDKASHNVWIDEPVIFRNALLDALTRKK